MIDPAGRLHNRTIEETIVSDGRRSQAPKTQSFAAALSDEFASRKTRASETEAILANPRAGQQNVTRRDPGITSSSTSRSAPGSTSGSTTDTMPQPSGLSGLVITFPDTTSGAASGTGSGTAGGTTAPSDTPISFDDAYWANQPVAVQQLRNIQDPSERTEVAGQLAQEGYSIDVPIMVWGWDPAITTEARSSMGYTWVPSALQQPVEVAPGLTFNGTSYNPANPPAGSITV
jgi:hypothetical protein